MHQRFVQLDWFFASLNLSLFVSHYLSILFVSLHLFFIDICMCLTISHSISISHHITISMFHFLSLSMFCYLCLFLTYFGLLLSHPLFLSIFLFFILDFPGLLISLLIVQRLQESCTLITTSPRALFLFHPVWLDGHLTDTCFCLCICHYLHLSNWTENGKKQSLGKIGQIFSKYTVQMCRLH